MDLIIEDDLKYCPRCQEEYRAEAETCADCGGTLLTGRAFKEELAAREAARAGRSMEITPDDELVDVRRGPVIQIKSYQSLLAEHRIPALAVGESGGCAKGCCGTDLLLRVRRDDLEDVLAILAEEHVRTTGLLDHDLSTAGAVFNTQAEQVTCPACGCTFPPTTSTCPDCGLCFA